MVYGKDGMDEISLGATTVVGELKSGEINVDWGMGEHLAFASLVASGYAVRLSLTGNPTVAVQTIPDFGHPFQFLQLAGTRLLWASPSGYALADTATGVTQMLPLYSSGLDDESKRYRYE